MRHIWRMKALVPLTFLLSPLLAIQALWVVARAQRLPEAPGPREGVVGNGPDLRLLVIGDSSAAGVGVTHQFEALAMQTATALGETSRVSWCLKAKNGATARNGLGWLADMKGDRFESVLIVFGVNDCKNGHARNTWRANLENMVHVLRDQNQAKSIAFMAVPPMGLFPLLPRPLRWILGQRATQFDQDMQLVAKAQNVTIARPDLPLDPKLMASDGFHPGADVYALCAQAAAAALKQGD